jgi:hypothetical protein
MKASRPIVICVKQTGEKEERFFLPADILLIWTRKIPSHIYCWKLIRNFFENRSVDDYR